MKLFIEKVKFERKRRIEKYAVVANSLEALLSGNVVQR
jgi:hypothetical protein